MIGIVSYGGYLPRLRLNRMSIYQGMGWFAPATIMVAQGERSFCNWDEDSMTMAVAASRDCLVGMDKSAVDGVFLCSTTLPFSDRLNAGFCKFRLKDFHRHFYRPRSDKHLRYVNLVVFEALTNDIHTCNQSIVKHSFGRCALINGCFCNFHRSILVAFNNCISQCFQIRHLSSPQPR